VVSLLSKPSRRQVEVDVGYLGTEIEDLFVVGYGLDYAERYRNVPEIHVLENDGEPSP
jgi:hypoxanthine phosphoribosyltransferase